MIAPRLSRAILVVLVGATFALRALLAAQGGQFFFGDEQRHGRGVALYLAVVAGDGGGARAVLAQPEHPLFNIVVGALTGAQHLLAQLTPYGDWSRPENVGFTFWLGAVLLLVFSAGNVFWVHRLARVTGAGEIEAGWAAALMAAAHTPLCYARHLLPYECALGAGLAALAVGLRRATPAHVFAGGVLGGAAAGLYQGYWFLAPVVWLGHAWWWRREPQRLRLAALCAAGIVIALGAPLAVGSMAGGRAYWSTLGSFSASVTQGVFAEGWSLPWEFLWASEHLAGAFVLGCVVIAGVRMRRAGEAWPARVTLALLLLGAVYGLLTLCSTGLGRFVVYGRSVLPMLPLGALLGGWALARLLGARTRAHAAAGCALAIIAALHYATHFALTYPRELEIEVLRSHGNPKRTVTFSGSLYLPLAVPVTRPDHALINTQFLYPLRAAVPPPAGDTILRFEHPLALRALQFDGHTPRERALLRTGDPTMRLVRLADPAATPDHPPAALRYGPQDFPRGGP